MHANGNDANEPTSSRLARTSRKRWAMGGASVLCAAALVGGAALSANAATPAPPSPTASHPATSQPKGSHPAGTKAKAAHKPGRELRAGLRIVIEGGPNAGDLAAAAAILVVDTHPAFESKLPAALQSDLKALAQAPASERSADAAKIKAGALGGTYGSKFQTEAKAIQAKPAKHPGTTK